MKGNAAVVGVHASGNIPFGDAAEQAQDDALHGKTKGLGLGREGLGMGGAGEDALAKGGNTPPAAPPAPATAGKADAAKSADMAKDAAKEIKDPAELAGELAMAPLNAVQHALSDSAKAWAAVPYDHQATGFFIALLVTAKNLTFGLVKDLLFGHVDDKGKRERGLFHILSDINAANKLEAAKEEAPVPQPVQNAVEETTRRSADITANMTPGQREASQQGLQQEVNNLLAKADAKDPTLGQELRGLLAKMDERQAAVDNVKQAAAKGAQPSQNPRPSAPPLSPGRGGISF